MNKTCRDCKFWKYNGDKERLHEYPRSVNPRDGWGIEAECSELWKEAGLIINISTGWEGGSVSSIQTDANFGCIFFEQK